MSEDHGPQAPGLGVDEDLADLFENAPCGYVSADPSGRIIKANRTLAAWLKVEAEALVGRRFQEFLSIAGKIYYETHFAPLLRMQGFFNEVALDLVDGTGTQLPVLVNALERRDARGDVAFIRITVFNAGDRRRYERALLEARRNADAARAELLALNLTLEQRVEQAVAERVAAEDARRQSQKMEAIGQLTGGVAHDFNNLLTVILGGLETVQKHAAALPDEPARRIQKAAAMAAHGAERAATLTAKLLAFARRRPLEARAVDPAHLVAGLTDLLDRTLGEGIELETIAPAGLWSVLVDAGELENALVNLAVNARDAMPDGGRLTIQASNARLDEAGLAAAEPVQAGPHVLIAVSDSGTGMDEDTLARVFEPFFTTKAAGRGTGLGLSQVYGFVRQTGGHIRISSERGRGTTVMLYLPRAPQDVADSQEPEVADAAASLGGGERILVVEDYEDLRRYVSEALSDLGYRVVAVRDAAQAVHALQVEGPFDLMFTDLVLPGGTDGRRLAGEATGLQAGLKVLFTTGYAHDAATHAEGDVAHLIEKPFTSQALARKVRAVLET